MTFFKSLTKAALITTTALTFSFSAKATDSFNPEFIAHAQSLSASNSVLFQGFQDTDFASLRAFLRPLPGNTEERVVPKALVQKLYDRVATFADSDPRQKALALEVQTALTNDNLDMYSYTAMIMRHQVFMRLKSGQACDFEKIALEVPGALGYELFEKVQNPKFWTKNHLVAEFIKDFSNPSGVYNVTIANVADDFEKANGEVPLLFYPSFNHHELGIVYLAYMFLNNAFPVSCPASVGPDQLHSMKMSQAGEIFHDFLHAGEFETIIDHIGFSAALMENYRTFLTEKMNERPSMITSENPAGAYVRRAFGMPMPQQIAPTLLALMGEKEDLMRRTMNQIFHQATKEFARKQLSENDYTTLMVGIFHRAHEEYFSGKRLFAATSAEEMLEAFFMSSHYDDNTVSEDSTNLDNPFATNVVDGSSPFSDEEIIQQAAKLPLKKFVGQDATDMKVGYFYYIVGGEVKRTPYHIGVTLQAQTGETLVLGQSSENYKWRLSGAHDTYLANLGSKGLQGQGLPELKMPDLSQLEKSPVLADLTANVHLSAVEERFAKIHEKAKEICLGLVSRISGDVADQSFKDQVNAKLAKNTKSIVNLFPESARAKVFEDIAGSVVNSDDDSE